MTIDDSLLAASLTPVSQELLEADVGQGVFEELLEYGEGHRADVPTG